jgi:hypothetical protein
MTIQSLTEQIRNKASFLCVGLDSDLTKLPAAVRITRKRSLCSTNQLLKQPMI